MFFVIYKQVWLEDEISKDDKHKLKGYYLELTSCVQCDKFHPKLLFSQGSQLERFLAHTVQEAELSSNLRTKKTAMDIYILNLFKFKNEDTIKVALALNLRLYCLLTLSTFTTLI